MWAQQEDPDDPASLAYITRSLQVGQKIARIFETGHDVAEVFVGTIIAQNVSEDSTGQPKARDARATSHTSRTLISPYP